MIDGVPFNPNVALFDFIHNSPRAAEISKRTGGLADSADFGHFQIRESEHLRGFQNFKKRAS